MVQKKLKKQFEKAQQATAAQDSAINTRKSVLQTMKQTKKPTNNNKD